MPEADAEHGRALLDPVRDELVEPELADPLHRLREGADAGQDHAVGRVGGLGVRGRSRPRRRRCSSAFSTERRLPIP